MNKRPLFLVLAGILFHTFYAQSTTFLVLTIEQPLTFTQNIQTNALSSASKAHPPVAKKAELSYFSYPYFNFKYSFTLLLGGYILGCYTPKFFNSSLYLEIFKLFLKTLKKLKEYFKSPSPSHQEKTCPEYSSL